MKKIKIGMAQLLVEGGEPERNFIRAEKLISEASENKCDIVLLPETIDFAWTHPSSKTEAKTIPGPYSDLFSGFARKYSIYICVGLTEKQIDKNLNTALLFNKDGEIILKYSKIHLLEVEHEFYDVGKSLKVVETEFGKIGVNICADNYPMGLSIGHTLAQMGAQIILSPSSWTVDYSITEEIDPYKDKWEKPLSTLAGLYNILIVSTTSVGYIVGGPYEGKKMVGCSLAADKSGIISKGLFNEFAGELKILNAIVPENDIKGTQIGDMLSKKNVSFFPNK